MSTARELDQFYTRPDVAKNCYEAVLSTLKIPDNTIFLEPSAGAGVFYELFPEGRRIGLDLDPKHPAVSQKDFFTYERKITDGPMITIGNPPFGKNSSLAVRFFNHAAEFSIAVAFIIPKTFRKVSLQRRLNDLFECVVDTTLPENSFVFEGTPYDVPCCFQIWLRKENRRVHTLTPTVHPDFSFVSKREADFAVRRVGALAGKVLGEFQQYSSASNYFIKANVSKNNLMGKLEKIDWSEIKANNAGNPSISKRELVAKYSEILSVPKKMSRTASLDITNSLAIPQAV